MNRENIIIGIVGLVLLSGLVILFTRKPAKDMNTTPTPSSKPTQTAGLPFDLFLKTEAEYNVELETSQGNITIKLFQDEVPNAANNFAKLVQDGFYNNLTFHRVIDGFMIQGGDPNGTGSGGPGYKFADEKITRDYTRGIVAYANSGPNTNGSQFFIMHQDNPLPKSYVIFGEVVEGIETVDKIATVKTVLGGDGAMSKPETDVVITKATLIEK